MTDAERILRGQSVVWAGRCGAVLFVDGKDPKGSGVKRPSYVDMGPYPGWVGICFDNETFQREMKRLGVKDEPQWVSDNANATTHNFIHPVNGEMHLVCVDGKDMKGRTEHQVYGILVHEAVHVKQNVFESIGEKYPGAEQEAYFVQHLAQWFARAWRDERKQKRGRG